MIYRFKSKATADLLMNAEPAQRIVQVIGKTTLDDGRRGIVRVEEMPAAIAALEAAIADDERARREAEQQARAEGRSLPAPGVTLRVRAHPFIDMLRRAAKAEVPVTWGD